MPTATRRCGSTRPATLHHRHVSVLLEDAGTTGDIGAQATALLALLDPDYVHHQLTEVARH